MTTSCCHGNGEGGAGSLGLRGPSCRPGTEPRPVCWARAGRRSQERPRGQAPARGPVRPPAPQAPCRGLCSHQVWGQVTVAPAQVRWLPAKTRGGTLGQPPLCSKPRAQAPSQTCLSLGGPSSGGESHRPHTVPCPSEGRPRLRRPPAWSWKQKEPRSDAPMAVLARPAGDEDGNSSRRGRHAVQLGKGRPDAHTGVCGGSRRGPGTGARAAAGGGAVAADGRWSCRGGAAAEPLSA